MAISGQIISVAIIDTHQLSRECLISAASLVRPDIIFIPFSSVSGFAAGFTAAIDLVLYIDHGSGRNLTDELTSLLHYVDKRHLIVVSANSENAERVLHDGQHLPATVIDAQKMSLQMIVSILYLVLHGRLNPHSGYIERFGNEGNPTISDSPPPLNLSGLTERERIVLGHIAKGQSNKEIALALEMSVSTVKAHLRSIMQKTGITNRVHLALSVQRTMKHSRFEVAQHVDQTACLCSEIVPRCLPNTSSPISR